MSFLQNAEKDEYSHKQKEMEDIFNPIITKMYKDAGAGAQPGLLGLLYQTR